MTRSIIFKKINKFFIAKVSFITKQVCEQMFPFAKLFSKKVLMLKIRKYRTLNFHHSLKININSKKKKKIRYIARLVLLNTMTVF